MTLSNATGLIDRINPELIPFSHVENKGAYSTVADLPGMVNDAFFLVLIISVALLVLVTFFMVYFAIRYRKKKNPTATEVKEPLMLEIAWTVIPTILVSVMFYVGWINFVSLRDTPDNAMPVKVTARMWSWQFEYENGLKSPALYVPSGKSVKLTLTSQDVIHSLFIPEFRLKEDAVPGMETFLWLVSASEGEYDIFCAEYCGRGHSSMNSKVIVLSEADFSTWYSSAEKKESSDVAPDSVMELLDDNGCLECHSTDGTRIEGPTFKALFGREETVITDGKERIITVDEAYIRKSIFYPDADVVKSYADVMPSYEGELSEEEISAIIQYLKDLK
jgi:cytochrome c oxidase subunit 2